MSLLGLEEARDKAAALFKESAAVHRELYRRFPDRAEQDISKMRAGVVNMYALADLARSQMITPRESA